MPNAADLLAAAVAHHQAGRLPEAEAAYRLCLQINPASADAHLNLALILHDQGRLDEADRSYRTALDLAPACAEAHNNFGTLLRQQGDFPGAIACYRRATELKPDYVAAHFNHGNALRDQGNQLAAVDSYRAALNASPHFAEAYCNLGTALIDLGRNEEGIDCYQQALRHNPNLAEAHNNLATELKDQGQVAQAVAGYQRAIELRPNYVAAFENLLYAAPFCPGTDARSIYELHRRWQQQYAEPLARSIAPHPNERAPDRRLRIAYISPDFRNHCLAHFTVPLFQHHDHSQFEVGCYSDVTRPDETTARLQSTVDFWRDTASLSDEQLALRIRQDQIDILVDQTMHMQGSRLLMFARKPAPVQVTWLAYPGTTGLSTIDYRLTDPYLDPPGMFDSCYSEESLCLRDTFWCYQPLTTGPEPNALPALASGHVTFGSLNNFCKVNDSVLELWSQVLRTVTGSRLILRAPEGASRQRTRQFFTHRGVASERITFIGRQPRLKYLQTYNQIDIGLDTIPYNGHTTSLDSFWMGVPVVTLVGQTVVGRAGLSQLTNLGLPELIAHTPDQFVQIAADLAADLTRLDSLRQSLRSRMEKSPLMDAPRFARAIESAYQNMWQRWCTTSTSAR